MKIRFHKKLYKGGISDRKLADIKRKVKWGFPKLNLFLITLPISNQGILEVYWYPELFQKLYRDMENELVVVGIAGTREKAFEIIKSMIEDIGVLEDSILVRAYFEE
ncbi:MAG: hypothetical protein K2I10_06385 [Lachnospiraceae bacterium]|nr:hypothetical protein [Lachnospiraceae bacterium]